MRYQVDIITIIMSVTFVIALKYASYETDTA